MASVKATFSVKMIRNVETDSINGTNKVTQVVLEATHSSSNVQKITLLTSPSLKFVVGHNVEVVIKDSQRSLSDV